VYAQGA
jgi:peptide-methionine (R)-S-oxide reductase